MAAGGGSLSLLAAAVLVLCFLANSFVGLFGDLFGEIFWELLPLLVSLELSRWLFKPWGPFISRGRLSTSTQSP